MYHFLSFSVLRTTTYMTSEKSFFELVGIQTLFCVSQLGPRIFFLSRWVWCIQFNLFTLHKPQDLVDWTAHFSCVCQAKALWHLDNKSAIISSSTIKTYLATTNSCAHHCNMVRMGILLAHWHKTWNLICCWKTCMTNHQCKLLHPNC